MATARQQTGNPLARFDQVYDLYRDCILNQEYYAHRLNLFSRIAFWLEVIIVVGSGASGVSGWIIWTKYPAPNVLWGIIAAVSTLLAALKPVLQTDTKIKRYSSLFSQYRQLTISMKMTVEEIEAAGGFSKEIDKAICSIQSRYRTLSMEDDARPSTKLVKSLQAEINNRIPTSSLFYPRSNASISPSTSAAAVDGNSEGVDVGKLSH